MTFVSSLVKHKNVYFTINSMKKYQVHSKKLNSLLRLYFFFIYIAYIREKSLRKAEPQINVRTKKMLS